MIDLLSLLAGLALSTMSAQFIEHEGVFLDPDQPIIIDGGIEFPGPDPIDLQNGAPIVDWIMAMPGRGRPSAAALPGLILRFVRRDAPSYTLDTLAVTVEQIKETLAGCTVRNTFGAADPHARAGRTYVLWEFNCNSVAGAPQEVVLSAAFQDHRPISMILHYGEFVPIFEPLANR